MKKRFSLRPALRTWGIDLLITTLCHDSKWFKTVNSLFSSGSALGSNGIGLHLKRYLVSCRSPLSAPSHGLYQAKAPADQAKDPHPLRIQLDLPSFPLGPGKDPALGPPLHSLHPAVTGVSKSLRTRCTRPLHKSRDA